MDAQMMIENVAVSSADETGFEGRKAAILRDSALPDAPFAMPRQIIEVARPSIADIVVNGLRRVSVMMLRGFGPAARGR